MRLVLGVAGGRIEFRHVSKKVVVCNTILARLRKTVQLMNSRASI